MKTNNIPQGKHINFDDDLVVVYNENNEICYQGEFDYCPYNDEDYSWDDDNEYYNLPNNYKMVCLK